MKFDSWVFAWVVGLLMLLVATGAYLIDARFVAMLFGVGGFGCIISTWISSKFGRALYFLVLYGAIFGIWWTY